MSVDNILMRKGLTEENPGSIWDMRFGVQFLFLHHPLTNIAFIYNHKEMTTLIHHGPFFKLPPAVKLRIFLNTLDVLIR